MMTPLTKTWIDRKLSRKERATLVEYLLERTTSPTSEEILAAIGELFPGKEKPGIRSVSDWKAKSWKFEVYLRELETENAKAQLISEKSADIADANKKMVDGYVFKNLEALKNGELDAVDPNIRGWIQAASQLASRSVNDKKLAADLERSREEVAVLKAKVAEWKRREADWRRQETEREAAKKKAIEDIRNGGGLSDEALARLEAQIGNL